MILVDTFFTMVEENFENWHLEMVQNNLILMIVVDAFFTMVEENFENWHLEIHQNNVILMILVDIFLHLKKILKMTVLDCPRMTEF